MATDRILSVVLKPRDGGEKIFGMVTDSSKQGIQVSVARELVPETEVEVFFAVGSTDVDDEGVATRKVRGVVRWCRENEFVGTSYDVGIETKK